MVLEKKDRINHPLGGKLTIREDPLNEFLFEILWKRMIVALLDFEDAVIEISPDIPTQVSNAIQLFIGRRFNLDPDDLAAFNVVFKRIR
jgi:hypothetical protein